MGWLSDFLGTKKVKTPPVQEVEVDFGVDYEDTYLKDLARRQGYASTIITGRKKPKLGALTLLG